MPFWRKKVQKKQYIPSQEPTSFSDSVDANHDGLVTRKEMEAYINAQLEEKEQEAIHWRQAYDDLFKKHNQVLEQLARDNTLDAAKQSNISGDAVQKFVDELLADPNVNIYGFPDKIEAALYRNVIRMILGAMENLFNNVNVDFIGHKITMAMVPVDPAEGEDFSTEKMISKSN